MTNTARPRLRGGATEAFDLGKCLSVPQHVVSLTVKSEEHCVRSDLASVLIGIFGCGRAQQTISVRRGQKRKNLRGTASGGFAIIVGCGSRI